jgi:hypothetical protein
MKKAVILPIKAPNSALKTKHSTLLKGNIQKKSPLNQLKPNFSTYFCSRNKENKNGAIRVPAKNN